MSEGTKHDNGKPPMNLLGRKFKRAVADVLAHGAEKYGEYNWAQGMKWSRIAAACERHLDAWIDGEDLDTEFGLSHLAHAACCLMFLIEYQERGLGEDDRHKWQKQIVGVDVSISDMLKQADAIVANYADKVGEILDNAPELCPKKPPEAHRQDQCAQRAGHEGGCVNATDDYFWWLTGSREGHGVDRHVEPIDAAAHESLLEPIGDETWPELWVKGGYYAECKDQGPDFYVCELIKGHSGDHATVERLKHFPDIAEDKWRWPQS